MSNGAAEPELEQRVRVLELRQAHAEAELLAEVRALREESQRRHDAVASELARIYEAVARIRRGGTRGDR